MKPIYGVRADPRGNGAPTRHPFRPELRGSGSSYFLYQKIANATRATVIIHSTMSLLRFFSSAMPSSTPHLTPAFKSRLDSLKFTSYGEPRPHCSPCRNHCWNSLPPHYHSHSHHNDRHNDPPHNDPPLRCDQCLAHTALAQDSPNQSRNRKNGLSLHPCPFLSALGLPPTPHLEPVLLPLRLYPVNFTISLMCTVCV